MNQPKRQEEMQGWQNSARKYSEVHEEITRKKNENPLIEEALFQVVTRKQVRIQFSDNESVLRKQSIKKIVGFFKWGRK